MNFTLPTDNHPFALGDSKLFPTFFEFSGEEIAYDQICGLTIHVNAKSYNGITTKEALLYVHFSRTDTINVLPQDTLELLMGSGTSYSFFNKQKYEKVLFAYSFLQKITFNNRLQRYLNEIQQKGHFNYTPFITSFLGSTLIDGARIFNNGDIHLPNGDKANLLEANQNELLGVGSELKGLKTKISNPCELVIFKKKGLKLNLLGFDLFPSIKIDYRYNQDIFLEILYRILRFGKVITK